MPDNTNVTDLPLLPLEPDLLGQDKYIQALSLFIKNAQTPMTIAVQGEWGCGKTSLMNALAGQTCVNFWNFSFNTPQSKEPINTKKNDYLGVWINTWQYSILKNESDAQISVIRGVAKELSAQMNSLMGTSSSVKEAGKRLLDSISGIALTAAKVGVSAAGINPISLNGLDEMLRTQENGPEYFRNKLKESIEGYIYEYNKTHINREHPIKGIIFFIDDLDRLDPPVAVQVLSLLKNLFEIPKCIFILAIDYEVVVEGLSSRFGQRNDSNEREFRSFFDKIIQLSFRVPIESYHVKEFLHEHLIRINYSTKDLDNDDFLKDLTNITLQSCGRNPRSIKRMLNTLSLVRGIHDISKTSLEQESRSTTHRQIFSKLLYALVCIQSAYPKLYDEIVKQPNLFDWFSDSFEISSEAKSADDICAQLDEIQPADLVLSDAMIHDPWIRKRQRSIQTLLLYVMKLVVTDKIALTSANSFSSKQLFNTFEHFDQILRASHLTDNSNGTNEEVLEFPSMEEFCAYWIEKDISATILKNMNVFCRRLALVFDSELSLQFSDNRISIFVQKDSNKNSKRKLLCSLLLFREGFTIRVGMSYRLGIGTPDIPPNPKLLKVNKFVVSLDELQERDIRPIKDRYKDFMGIGRVPTTWLNTRFDDEQEAKVTSTEECAQ